jgi:P27 family predicted phage terminase small subunit
MGLRGPKSAASLEIVAGTTVTKPRATVAKDKPSAPKHLSPATRDWWDEVVSDFELETHHLRLLQAACESWERMQAARAAIGRHGLTFVDSQGNPKARPEIAIERDAKIGFARLIRELDLDSEPPAEGRRPPSLRSNRG